MDQMFTLDKRHLESEYVTYRRSQTRMKDEVRKWLADHKAIHSFRVLENYKGILHIHDRDIAILFKLSWM